MSFFRNLFSTVVNKFPEYSDFLASVESLRASGATIIESDMNAFSPEFDRFAKSQPAEVQVHLASIKSAGDTQARAMRHFWGGTGKLPSDLDQLRLKNLNYQNKEREVQAARSLAQASRAAVPKAQEALDRAERKGNQAEVRRLVDRLEEAKAKADSDEAAAAAADESWADFQKRYPAEFSDLLGSILEPVVDAKLEELRELEGAADTFIEAAQHFEFFDDPSNARLRQRLEELNAIVVD
jgi:hypothetical protein